MGIEPGAHVMALQNTERGIVGDVLHNMVMALCNNLVERLHSMASTLLDSGAIL